MRYNALLFCPDEKTARVVTQVLTDLEFRVEPCNEPFAAVKKLMAEHFDAIVVDCDSEQNAALLFKSAHNSGSNQSSLAVAVVEGQAGVAKAFRIGANLVLTKPINVEQSKGTLRVARGLLRKTDAAKPANPTPPAQPTSRPVTTIDARRTPAPQISELRPPAPSLPTPPPPSPIPSVNASIFEVEADPGPKPEPTEAALLESMPDPTPTPATGREYPWQPVSKPAAEPMATALRRAAEATGRSEVEAPVPSKAPSIPASVPEAPVSHSFASGTSSQGAATAPAKELPKPEEYVEAPQVDAPTFAALGESSAEPGSGGSKKTVLIAAAVLVAVGALGYVGWTKIHPANEASAPQTLNAPARTAPVQSQPPASVPSSPNAAPSTTAATTPSHPVSSLPVEQGPDIMLSTNETHPPTAKKSTSIIAPDTVVRNPVADTPAPAPMVVKSQSSDPAPAAPPAQETIQPPAPGSLDASNANDQALSGIMNSTGAALPKQPAPTLKVSQGVSQGLLVKSVQPVYPATAKQMHVQGSVELLANIGKDGSITSVKVLSGPSVLARAAIDAVKQWQYKPYYLDDQPVEIQTQITVNFKLP
jgi:periplasmic protein TonB